MIGFLQDLYDMLFFASVIVLGTAFLVTWAWERYQDGKKKQGPR